MRAESAMFFRVARAKALCLAALVCIGGALSANSASTERRVRQTAQESVQVFKASVDVVRLGVRVVDKNRRAIRGLTADKFSVWVDDVLQPVVAVSEVDASDLAPAGAAWTREVTSDVVTNEGADRRQRLWALLIDDCSLGTDPFETRMAQTIARDIVTGMGPTDKAAVIFTWNNAPAQDFTASHAKLFAAIDTTAPGPRGAPCRVERNIHDAWEFLDALDNPRAALAYIGHPRFPPKAALPSEDGPGEVPFYGFSVLGLVAPDSRPSGQMRIEGARSGGNSLRYLADESGGAASVDTNAPDRAVPEMFAETGTTYLVGYRPTYPAGDGHERRLRIRVRRDGAVVLPPDHVFVSKRAPDPSVPVAPWMSVRNALAGLLPDSHSPLRVNLLPMAAPTGGFGKPQGTVALVLGLSLDPAEMKSSGRAAIDLETVVFDGEGRKEVLSQTQQIQVSNAGEYDVLSKLDLKPGRYNVRCAAVGEKLGFEGSAYADVVVPDVQHATLSVSGLAVTSMPAPVAIPFGALAELLPTVPTTRREFAPTDRVTAFIRVYQAASQPALPLTLTVHMEDAFGHAVDEASEVLPAARFTATHSADWSRGVPVARLAKGQYLLSVTVAGSGRTASQQAILAVTSQR